MLRFSAKPGFWERHVQRKYENPQLFVSSQGMVQEIVDAARQRDQQESQHFKQDFNKLLADMAALQGAVDTDVVLQLKERIDRLYIHCAGCGYLEAEGRALLKLHDVVMSAVVRASASDPLASEEIAQEQAAHKMHLRLLACPLTAHLLRVDSPVAGDELMATLLAEPVTSLRVVLELFDAAQLSLLCFEARNLLVSAASPGADLALARERLALMEGVAGTVSGAQTYQ